MQGKLVGLDDLLEVEYAPHVKVCKRELTQNLGS